MIKVNHGAVTSPVTEQKYSILKSQRYMGLNDGSESIYDHKCKGI
jgi:hypothetical protein